MQKVSQLKLDQTQKTFLIGALLAMAFFFVAAGIAEIAIAMDQECRDEVAMVRLSPDPFTVCLPEWKYYGLRAVSRGVVWAFNPEAAPIFGWLVMSMIYAVLGGISAQVFGRRGIIAFLGIFLALIALFAGLGFMKTFIA
ncbi:MAG: hypothetical protein U9N80_07660 [Chloroflexota bacterium]|nr:hypothetical protein [Chloroflexota bacterium]